MRDNNQQHEYDVETCIEELNECFRESVPARRLDDIGGLDAVVEKAHTTIVRPHLEESHVAAASTALFRSHSGDVSSVPRAIAGELGAAGYEVSRIDLQERKHGRYFQQQDRLATCIDALIQTQPHVLLLEGVESLQVRQGDPLGDRLTDLATRDEAVVVLAIDETHSDRQHHRSYFDDVVDVTFGIPTPDANRRAALLKDAVETAVGKVSRSLTINSLAYDQHADKIEGFSAHWVRRVGQRAVTLAVATQGDSVTKSHLKTAVKQVDDEHPEDNRPWSDRRGGQSDSEFSVDTPDVTFADVGGLDDIITRIQELVDIRQRHADLFEEAGFSTSHGLLLKGPPGTGKTLLAKAVANELDRPFLSVKGPELKHPLYGMTERKIRNLFETADEEAPCVVFFDEFDAVAASRDEVSHSATESQVATLLTELDGIEERGDILVLAATNRPDALDDAVTRQGRLDEVVEVSVPDTDEQADIFEVHADPLPIAADVTSSWFVGASPNSMTGADIAGICKEAFHAAVRNADDEDRVRITREQFRSAIERVCSSAQADNGSHAFR